MDRFNYIANAPSEINFPPKGLGERSLWFEINFYTDKSIIQLYIDLSLKNKEILTSNEIFIFRCRFVYETNYNPEITIKELYKLFKHAIEIELNSFVPLGQESNIENLFGKAPCPPLDKVDKILFQVLRNIYHLEN